VNVGAVKFNFRKYATVGVCGVEKRCGDCQELMFKKTGSVLFKWNLALTNDSVRGEEGQTRDCVI
jgi:hypothetical protein